MHNELNLPNKKIMKHAFFLILFIVTYTSNSQNHLDLLRANPWHLDKIIINNVDYFPPNVEPVGFNDHYFTDDIYPYFVTGYCDGVKVRMGNAGECCYFTLADNDLEFYPSPCNLQESIEFNTKYFSIYFQNNNPPSLPKHPFTYFMNQNGQIKTLIIRNNINDSASYSYDPLAINDLNLSSFSIYPNPTKNILNIQSKTSVENLKIYNTQGVLIKEFFSNEIDVSGLISGMYFIKVAINGNIGTKKFIKM